MGDLIHVSRTPFEANASHLRRVSFCMESDMTTESPVDIDTGPFRALLEESLTERLAIIEELAPHALPSIDPMAYQTLAANRRAVDEITNALNRIDAGTYGRCARCSGWIAPARLEAVPHAATCIDCSRAAA
ncbi:DnaK suppressor protein [Microbacterium oleivorans]|uniref:DnaK suppressor protein n=2 Tax=Microbacterium oleivorans TaxID=273677 RepID=A0A031FUW9_9MICO|nr:DnaK suppressor protein [Microbacterium oleivorans]